jgi:outer membrane protein assembly factor BamB
MQPANNAPPSQPDTLVNPLRDVIRQIFAPRGPLFPGRPARVGGNNQGGGASRSSPSDRDFIDSRAPHDAKVEHQLRLAEAAVKKKDWKQAVGMLQQLLDLPEDSLHRLPDGRWQSVRVTAARLLGKAPAAVLESYQQQNGGLARQMLNDALQEGDLPGVIRVATRFFHTEAGYQAADYLVTLHQDRAEFGIAAQWVTELSASKASFVQNPAWQLKAALTYRLAGHEELADSLLKSLADGGKGVRIAGDLVQPMEWLAQKPAAPQTAPTPLDDWPQLYGAADRTGHQSGGAPFLMPQWQIPYASNHFVRQRVEWLIQDLLDQERPVIPAAQPLAVNGKAVYRDLRGVRVVDLSTGQSLWESIEGISPERIISGHGAEEDSSVQVVGGMNDPFAGHQADYHPLTSLLLRDAAYQTLSSDGRQLFFLEDQAIMSRQQPGFHWGWEGEQADPYGFSWTTNRLSSYDLETGRPLWTVGGPETNESFQLPLAGVYFHGAPTPDGDELFAIGSKGDEMRLWCLDRRTGGVQWSQLIGYADTKIDQDIGRRWMAAIPSVAQGIVVCPTTIGWLVAVDRLRQTVLWAVRYTPPTQGMDHSMGNNFAPQRELGGQWGGSAAVISGNRVVFTPPEDQLLICVDLLTGAPKWQVPRENGQYLAGVVDDRVVIVEMSHVVAYSLSSGKKVWTHELGDGARPSGRGALTADVLFLPLSSGELRAVQLADGKTASQTFVPSGQHPLGNLLLHRGRLLSLTPHGLTSYRQQSALLEEIQQRKAQNPRDPEALLSEAELHILSHEEEKALPLLRQIVPADVSGDLKSRWHGDLVTALSAVIRRNLNDSETALAELHAIAESPEERLLHLDLSAERFRTLGRHLEAFDLYWRLTTESTTGMVNRTDDPKVFVQRTAWLAGRLRDVWSASKENARSQIDARIAEAVAQTGGRGDEERLRLVELLGFHPLVGPLVRQAIESRLAADETAVAELELLRLVESGNRDDAAWATWKLGELMERLKLPLDAARHYRRLETDFADVPLSDGHTGAEVAKSLRQAGRIRDDAASRQIPWDERPMKVVQLMYQYYGQPNQDVTPESRWPLFESLDIEFLPNEQRLSFESHEENGFRWLAPLRASPTNHYGGYMRAEAVGHSLALVHQDVLHFLSPVQKRMLWNVALDGLADGGLPPLYSNRPPIFPMWAVSQESGYQSPLLQRAGYAGRLAAVQTGYLAVHGRRMVHVLDARTGIELWRRTNVLPQTKVLGGPDVVWFIPPRIEQSVGFRAADGTPLKINGLGKALSRAIGLVGNDLVLIDQGPGLKLLGLNRTKAILRRYNPLTQTDVWKQEFGAGALFAALSDEEILAVQSSGAVELVDAASGAKRAFSGLATKDLQSRSECYALADEERIFLIVNRQANGGYHHFAESLPSIRVHGTIFAWNRRTGDLAWKQSLSNQHLITERLRNSPVLLFCSREWKQRGNVNFSQLSLAVIHKQTGKMLHDSSTPMMYSGIHSMAILPKEQALELRSYNLRLKLVPTDARPETKGSD